MESKNEPLKSIRSKALRHRHFSLRTPSIRNQLKAPKALKQIMHCFDLHLSWLQLKAFAMSRISFEVLCCANNSNCYTTPGKIQMKRQPLIYSPLEAINSVQTNVKSTAKQFITSSFLGRAHSVTESFNPVMWFSDTSTQTIPPASNKIKLMISVYWKQLFALSLWSFCESETRKSPSQHHRRTTAALQQLSHFYAKNVVN